MVTKELLDYIEKTLKEKVPEEKIKSELLAIGWNPSDIEEGFAAVKGRQSPASGSPPAIPQLISGPKETGLASRPFAGGIEPKKRRGRGVLITLIFLILLGGGGFAAYSFGLVPESWYGYLPSEWFAWLPFGPKTAVAPPLPAATSTPPLDETAGWQTFRHSDFPFEFKYPPDWEIDQKTFDLGGPIALDNFNHRYISGGFIPEGKAAITVATNTLSASLDSFIISQLKGATIEATTTQAVGGEVGIRVRWHGDEKAVEQAVSVYIPHDKILYKFFLEGNINDFSKVFDEILSTFKFIPSASSGQVSPIDTSAWQTYRNKKYGFEVKYPPKWSVSEKTGESVGLDFVVVIFSSPDKRLNIEIDNNGVYGGSYATEEEQRYVDQILSTFKFTK